MATYTVNFLKVRKNADWRRTITCYSAPATPLDISAASFTLKAKNKLTGAVVLTATLGDGLQFATDGTDGKLMINVDTLVLADIPVGKYIYDVKMVRDGADDIIIEGTVKFVEGVS